MHVNHTSAHKFTRLPTTFTYLFIAACTAKHIQNHCRGDIGFGSPPLHCICQNSSNAFCPCPSFTYATIMALKQPYQVHTSILNPKASSLLSNMEHMSMRLSNIQFMAAFYYLCMDASQHLNCWVAHAWSAWTKMKMSGPILSSGVCWESSIVFLNSPAWTCWASHAFDEVSKCAITGSTLPNNKVSVCCCARVSAYCVWTYLTICLQPNPADQLCTTHRSTQTKLSNISTKNNATIPSINNQVIRTINFIIVTGMQSHHSNRFENTM